jgi:hypothetical protein
MTSWIQTALKNLDPAADKIVIENPAIRDKFDEILRRLWPDVRGSLESSGYDYTPTDEAEIKTVHCHGLVRSMSWMLYESTQQIYRGVLKLSQESWMVTSEFFLSLPDTVDFKYLRPILSNSRFSGYPPELSFWDRPAASYYQIRFAGGIGESWSATASERILARIAHSIKHSAAMNDIAIDNEWNELIVAEFLTEALEVYETH